MHSNSEFNTNENESSRLHTSKTGLSPLILAYWTRPLTKHERCKAKGNTVLVTNTLQETH